MYSFWPEILIPEPPALSMPGRLAEKFSKPVIFVAGNHEYYGQELKATEQEFRDKALLTDSVFFLEKESIVLHNTRFLGCTLWTDFSLYKNDAPEKQLMFMDKARDVIRDFRKIRWDQRTIAPTDMAGLKNECVNWLDAQLAIEHSGPTVVITHFAPVPECVDVKWRKEPPDFNVLSPYFVNDLTDLINRRQPDLWLYGHTHSNIDLQIGRTRIISNQRGYLGEKNGYDQNKLIGIETIRKKNEF